MGPLRGLGGLARWAARAQLGGAGTEASCLVPGLGPAFPGRHYSTSGPAAVFPGSTDDSQPIPGSDQAISPQPLAADLPGPSPSSPVDAADALGIAAHTSLEDSFALFFSPTQLGVQLWEGVHTATGLPWWASIPAATVAVRGLLLPLSLKAYAASSQIALLHRAVGLSRSISEAVESTASSASAEAASAKKDGDEAAASTSGSGRGAGKAAAASLGRVELVRRVMAQLREAQGPTPSFGWYLGNAAVQVPLAMALTQAMRRMSEGLWPGLVNEGALYFGDLTAPPVYLQTWSTPYGTAGAILPLALVLVYLSGTDRAAGATSPGIFSALKLLCLPLYVVALLQPHAVLLYWLSLAATQVGVYELGSRVPALQRPDLKKAGAEGSESDDDAKAESLDDLLLGLSEAYSKAGNAGAARACLLALLTRQPGLAAAEERLRQLEGK
ncbi:hypothetical protein HYH03_003824 [Edaphochlamys debaryana]|uniref:Uncharacterized protein n=1 Tax=Edaphochlamys debaryana TaxID=47281 RepID=A0A835Y8M0_9CHLO|nr:hypothetical protein HYH03_003824 [Edaphochlamys debaryana]|eukprot:KAG2498063.1 hypothetical protein HYH03_003824 [Edaphochlamys debaryana]